MNPTLDYVGSKRFTDYEYDLSFEISSSQAEGDIEIALSSMHMVLVEGGFDATEGEHIRCYVRNIVSKGVVVTPSMSVTRELLAELAHVIDAVRPELNFYFYPKVIWFGKGMFFPTKLGKHKTYDSRTHYRNKRR